jgi:hypothetical protein
LFGFTPLHEEKSLPGTEISGFLDWFITSQKLKTWRINIIELGALFPALVSKVREKI